jgi:hypothetical protein
MANFKVLSEQVDCGSSRSKSEHIPLSSGYGLSFLSNRKVQISCLGSSKGGKADETGMVKRFSGDDFLLRGVVSLEAELRSTQLCMCKAAFQP